MLLWVNPLQATLVDTTKIIVDTIAKPSDTTDSNTIVSSRDVDVHVIHSFTLLGIIKNSRFLKEQNKTM